MLLESIIIIVKNVTLWVLSLLPSTSMLPLPDWFASSIVSIFAIMKLFLELPIINVLYDYFLIWFGFWLVIKAWNLGLKLLSTVPFFTGLSKWSIGEHKTPPPK